MSLIKCSECGKEISDHAVACPSCGNPIHNQVAPIANSNEPVEIELTSKRWKKKFIWSIIFFLIGWMAISQSVVIGILLMILGLATAVVASIGRWWTNG